MFAMRENSPCPVSSLYDPPYKEGAHSTLSSVFVIYSWQNHLNHLLTLLIKYPSFLKLLKTNQEFCKNY